MGASHNTLIEALEANSFYDTYPTIIMLTKVWKTVKNQMRYNGCNEYTPIWNNRNLQEIHKIGKVREWEDQGIKKLRQLYSGNTLQKFSELESEFNLSPGSFYAYLQLEHALKAQFKNYSLVWNETPLLHSIFQVAPTKGLISKIYN